MNRRFVRFALSASFGATALSGCSSLGPDEGAAGEVALAFSGALNDGDGSRACELMTEAARTELEDSSEESCDTAVLAEDIPSAERVLDIAAYGRTARVVLDGDVVFLSVADGGWRVAAAGCRPQPEAPYDCAVAAS